MRTVTISPTERELLVLRRRIAGDPFDGIGLVLGVTYERARQIFVGAAEKVDRLSQQAALSPADRSIVVHFEPRLRAYRSNLRR